jgi:hypothetical protein
VGRHLRKDAEVIAGHFGFAAVVKARSPTTPLWALMLASQWLDVVFVPLLLAHVETLEPLAGSKPEAYGGSVIHADYTHSLAGAIVLSALFGCVFWKIYGRSAAAVLGLTAFSHWVLDLLFHHADMPILPGGTGNLPRLGFGVWSYPTLAAVIELALVIVGAAAYRSATRRLATLAPDVKRRAALCSSLIAAGGALTLGLNAAGL